MVRTSETDPLYVDFIPKRALGLPGKLGLTIAPGKKDRHAKSGPTDRDLDADLSRLRHEYGVDVLVTLLEAGSNASDELALLGIPDLLARAEEHGLHTDWVPMPDGGAPSSLDELIALVERILQALRAGRTVVVHCRGGLGRSGLVAAACVTAVGAPAAEAIETVRLARRGAVETAEQERFVHAFDKVWRRRLMRLSNPDDISDLVGLPPARTSSGGARVSQTGVAPLSYAGAATVSYLGLTAEARTAGAPDGSPLREGDLYHLLPGTSLYVGRGAECDVTLASPQLSRVHCLFAYLWALEGRLVVADLRSRNGTWIGGERVEVYRAQTGEEILLGKAYRFRFESIG